MSDLSRRNFIATVGGSVDAVAREARVVYFIDMSLSTFAKDQQPIEQRVRRPAELDALLRAINAGQWGRGGRDPRDVHCAGGPSRCVQPIRTLHDAVTLAEIADVGLMLPMLTNLPASRQETVRDAAVALKRYDAQ